MNVFEKSLKAVDEYLEKTPQEEIDKIIAELSKYEYEGPTLEEFFNAAFHDDPKFIKSQSGFKKKL